jgi:hypothetical protein
MKRIIHVDEQSSHSYDLAMITKGVASLLASPRRVRQGITYVLLIAVVGAVILPILAPAIDHHVIEKLPGHGHIYPGGIPVDHGHAHEAAHAHGEEASLADGSGIVFLPPADDTTGVSGFNVISAVLALSLVLVIPSLPARQRLILNTLLSSFSPHVETPPPQVAL